MKDGDQMDVGSVEVVAHEHDEVDVVVAGTDTGTGEEVMIELAMTKERARELLAQLQAELAEEE